MGKLISTLFRCVLSAQSYGTMLFVRYMIDIVIELGNGINLYADDIAQFIFGEQPIVIIIVRYSV